MPSLLIRHGTVIDGSGQPGFVADVAVEGDRITAVGPDLPFQAGRVIDADGLMVAPGFIDMHAHSDLSYHQCPTAESKVRQGVTTEVVGMCSFSPAPVAPGRAEMVRAWAAGLGTSLDIRWNTFKEYLDHLRGLGVALNVAHFVGHGALRLAAVGAEDRPPIADEMRHMQHDLAEALDAVAFGFSTGLIYAPSAYAATDELIALTRSMASRGAIYCSHIRGEAGTLEQAIAEAIRIGEEGGTSVQISHVKASGRENWNKMDRVLATIDAARARGVEVTGDVYPYTAGSSKMDNLMPAWMHDGGIDKLLACLQDPQARQRAITDCVQGDHWRGSSGAVAFEDIKIATCSRPEWEGLDIADLARRTGQSPAEVMMDLVLAERATVSMVVFAQSEDNVTKVLCHPHVMVGSDSIALCAGPGPHTGKPHPRTYGTFPRVLARYCRERRLFAWETAIHKMTGQAAARLRLKGRGLVRAGFAADLTLFDPATVQDEATYADPHRHPKGIPFVIVNGQVVVEGLQMHTLPAGRVLAPA